MLNRPRCQTANRLLEVGHRKSDLRITVTLIQVNDEQVRSLYFRILGHLQLANGFHASCLLGSQLLIKVLIHLPDTNPGRLRGRRSHCLL